MNNPFDLNDTESYLRWREQKLATAPASADELIVEVRDPRALTPNEHAALAERIRRCNMAIYASSMHEADTDIPRLLGAQFGLVHLDANWLAGEDGISEIRVFDNGTRQHYIPYTDRPIKWHTDGYYNPPERTIRGMVLHCVRNASSGGENQLMDHEMAYLLLRDEDPQHIRALDASRCDDHPGTGGRHRRRARRAERPGVLAGCAPEICTCAIPRAPAASNGNRMPRRWQQSPHWNACWHPIRRMSSKPDSNPAWDCCATTCCMTAPPSPTMPPIPRLLYRARYLDRIAL